jgi:UDP-glucuronate 4-epimerase
MFKKETVLVTGGCGFIGSHLVCRLIKEGHKVVIIDNMNSDIYDKKLKFQRLKLLHKKVEKFYHMDLRNRPHVQKVIKKHNIEKIMHLAAHAGVRHSIDFPDEYTSDIEGTVILYDVARLNGIKDIVFASSSSVYGLNEQLPFMEREVVDRPISIYAASKRSCELLGFTFCNLHNMNISNIRFFTVYGPWGRPDMALFSFVTKILNGQEIEIFNNGNMTRDFTFVTDIVDGLYRAMNKPAGFKIYNLGSGESIGLIEFVKEIEKSLGKTAKIINKPMQLGDVKNTLASIELAKIELGYKPQVSIRKGIPLFVNWFIKHYNVKE